MSEPEEKPGEQEEWEVMTREPEAMNVGTLNRVVRVLRARLREERREGLREGVRRATQFSRHPDSCASTCSCGLDALRREAAADAALKSND